MAAANDFLVIGRVIDVYGLKGWVKLKSFTQPPANLLQYRHCHYFDGHEWKQVTLELGKEHGKGLVAKFAGFDDRTAAEALLKVDFAVRAGELPVLDGEEYYWHQLQGLQVLTGLEGAGQLLGRVDHLFETGSNDVLVVKPCGGSIDRRERLLPYRPEVVLKVDIPAGQIRVDWDIEF